MAEWFEELDFDENPLKTNTAFIGNKKIIDEAFYSIIAGNILILEGSEGSGKTRVLKEIINRFGGKGKIAYIDSQKLEKELNVEKVIRGRNGLLGQLFQFEPRGMILLLDNVEALSSKNMERIKQYFDANVLQSVIIVTQSFSSLQLSESLRQRVTKIVNIPPLSEYEAVQLVQKLVGDGMIEDKLLREAYRRSGRNIKLYLENCEILFKAFATNKRTPLTEEDLQKLLPPEAR